MKLRLTRPYEGWLFVFPPAAVKVGSVLKFEGSWQGYTAVFAVTKISKANFSGKQKGEATQASDRVRLRSTTTGTILDRTIIGVCYSARWSLRVAEED